MCQISLHFCPSHDHPPTPCHAYIYFALDHRCYKHHDNDNHILTLLLIPKLSTQSCLYCSGGECKTAECSRENHERDFCEALRSVLKEIYGGVRYLDGEEKEIGKVPEIDMTNTNEILRTIDEARGMGKEKVYLRIGEGEDEGVWRFEVCLGQKAQSDKGKATEKKWKWTFV